jgi:hypothetical protein
VARLICRCRSFPTLGKCRQQRTDAFPVSELSLSADLKSGAITISL